MTPLDPLAWNQLVEAIITEKCILFLGPGATLNYLHDYNSLTGQQNQSQADFFKSLTAQYPNRILSYHESDGFLVFKDQHEKRLLLSEIRAYYRLPRQNEVMDLLAEIPFHLYIVVTPDLSLNHAFEHKGFDFKHQSYTTKIKRTLDTIPASSQPLLYNLLGCENDPESLITTHSDFFDLIKSIYGDKNLPDELISFFNGDRTHNIIFLGFEFDKWYFQLLLHLLRIKFEDGFLYSAAKGLPATDNQLLMEAQFKVSFVSSDIDAFVRTLHGQFASSRLRKRQVMKKASVFIKQNILKFISQSWTAQDFEIFCMIHFERVHAEFTPGMSHSARVHLLMQHLETHGLFDKLLQEGRIENPFQYQACGPYHAG